jgi:DNA-binding GntR family transcriptional regulator
LRRSIRYGPLASLSRVREAIVRGDLPPGSPIKQDATARELGLSVIPVREALKTLASEGIITYRAQRGYAVAELHADSVDGIFRVRELLEGEAGGAAAGRTPRGRPGLLSPLPPARDLTWRARSSRAGFRRRDVPTT